MNPAVLVFAALFAVAGYQRARWFQRQYGTTPWGWHPAVWAVIMFLSWVIGVILLAIAERQGRNRAARRPTYSIGYDQQVWGQQGYGQPALAGATPAMNRFGITMPSETATASFSPEPAITATAAPTVTAAAPAAAPAAPPAMWAADPSGRYQYRWWDGAAWTANVSSNGVAGQDPV